MSGVAASSYGRLRTALAVIHEGFDLLGIAEDEVEAVVDLAAFVFTLMPFAGHAAIDCALQFVDRVLLQRFRNDLPTRFIKLRVPVSRFLLPVVENLNDVFRRKLLTVP